MGDPVDAHREHAGIGENHFIQVGGGRIAVEGGLHIAYQERADLGQAAQKDQGQLARARRALAELGARLALAPVAQAMLHLALDLRRKLAKRCAM